MSKRPDCSNDNATGLSCDHTEWKAGNCCVPKLTNQEYDKLFWDASSWEDQQAGISDGSLILIRVEEPDPNGPTVHTWKVTFEGWARDLTDPTYEPTPGQGGSWQFEYFGNIYKADTLEVWTDEFLKLVGPFRVTIL